MKEHPGGTLEASGRYLGSIKETSGRPPGFGTTLVMSGFSLTIWCVVGVSGRKMCASLKPFAFFIKSVNFTLFFWGALDYDFILTWSYWNHFSLHVGVHHWLTIKTARNPTTEDCLGKTNPIV